MLNRADLIKTLLTVALLVIVLQAISVYMAAALVLPDATGVTRTDA